MLTLHSTRKILPGTKLWVYVCLCSIIGAIGLAGVGLVLISHVRILQYAGIIALVAIAGSQLVLLCMVLLNPDETHQFYDQLSKQRMVRPDFVESYRHMKEHGNAVSIVLFELLLAFIIWSLRPVGPVGGNAALVGRVGLILAVWLTPSALVWLIGSSLERYLSRSSS